MKRSFKAEHRRRRQAKRLATHVADSIAEANALATRHAAELKRLKQLNELDAPLSERRACRRTAATHRRKLAAVVAKLERLQQQADKQLVSLSKIGYLELADGSWLTPAGAVVDQPRR